MQHVHNTDAKTLGCNTPDCSSQYTVYHCLKPQRLGAHLNVSAVHCCQIRGESDQGANNLLKQSQPPNVSRKASLRHH
jgi:hypothetical protein